MNMLRRLKGRKLEVNDNSQRNDAYEEELNENAEETLVSSLPRGFDRGRHNRFEATRHDEGCQTGGSAVRQCYPKVRRYVDTTLKLLMSIENSSEVGDETLYQICGRFMSLVETPKSKLNCTATINSLYDAFDNVKHMVDALVRAYTKTCVLPSITLMIYFCLGLIMVNSQSKTLLLSRFHQGQIMETAK